MNQYNQTIDYLFALHRIGIKLGLENIIALLDAVGNPQNDWPAIHIAGTNGKGSTAAMLESILMKGGYRVGLYTSPHLIDFTERIRINRRTIPEIKVVEFVDPLRPLIEKLQPSFFEVTTALAFWYFSQQKIDVAIVETGMGGRLDSTNVVNPLVTLISPIGYDHQNYLGSTIEQITFEKAGIIKEGIPAITNNRQPAILDVLAGTCQKKNAPLIKIYQHAEYKIHSLKLDGTIFDIKVNDLDLKNVCLNLPGEHQLENAMLAIAGISHLKDKYYIPPSTIIRGLQDVVWQGRLHTISTRPKIIIDVSHNPDGFEKTLTFIAQFYPKEKLNVITFLQEDKDFHTIGELLAGYSNQVIITNLRAGKPLNPEKLYQVIQKKGGQAIIVDTFTDAKEEIDRSEEQGNLWLIIGSHYLAGEAYQRLCHLEPFGQLS